MENPFEPEDDLLRRKMAAELDEIACTVMPFGRCAGRKLHELPAEYLQWFVAKGWPKGRLGQLMQMVHQMKVDGSDIAFDAYRTKKIYKNNADS